MPGHVFIVPGDIRRLDCDAWLLPTDRRGRPENFLPEHWRSLAPDFAWPEPDEDWRQWRRRVAPLQPQPAGEPRAWLVNVTYDADSGQDREAFYRTSVSQALDTVLTALGPSTKPRHGRAVPLLALPFLGSGWGMKMVERGELLRTLLPLLAEALGRIEHTADVALVTVGIRQFAAAQHARLDLGQGWPDLDEGLRRQAERLAMLAARDRLSLFVGAGVGVGAGLPTWDAMIEALAREKDLPEEELGYLTDTSRDVLDRAAYLEVLAGGPAALREAVTALMERYHHYSLAHALLAGLPVREVITTNYDELFERAWSAAAAEPQEDGGLRETVRTSVIPYHWESDHQRWLLKLHGTVSRPDTIVLTRQSYIRFSQEWAALEGLLQATLLTRHMLFVGFSLKDENFVRILDAVRRIGRAGGAAPAPRSFGTALMIGSDPMFQRLYQGDLQWLSLEPPDAAAAGRRLELFLDCLLAQTRSPAHLLDEDFESVLSGDECRLRERLLQLARSVPDEPRSPAWEQVEELLRAFGWVRQGGKAERGREG